MADNPQLARPENQLNNPNRQTLNIAQPAEPQTQGPSFDFSTVPLVGGGSASDPNNPSIGLGDVARSVAASPLDMVSDIAEIPKAVNQGANTYADNQAKSGAYQKLGLSDNAQETINRIRGTVTKGVNATAGTIGNAAQSASEAIKSGYSEGAKQAAAMPFIEKDAQGDYKLGAGAFDKDAWMLNAVPMVAQLLTGGAVAKLGAMGARRAVEDAVFNRLSKTLPEDAARDVARETADRAAQRVGKGAFVGTMTATAQGQAGLDMHAHIATLPFDQLMQSPTFQSAFSDVDNDPANANLSDSQKLDLARNQVADQAASAVTTDPKLLAANIAAATLGDHTLLSLLTKKGAATGLASGIATGVLAGGLSGAGQGAVQQYTQNQQMADATGQPIDPMQGVVEAGLNQGAIGAGLGGVAGVIGGARGRRNPEQTEPASDAANVQSDNGATPEAQQTAPEVSPYDAARQQFASMDNDQTSLIAREVGGALNLSPKMLDHIINGYTGTLGSYVLGATNIMMRQMGDYGASPALRLDEMPVIKSFFRDDPAKNTQFIEDFYRMMTTANQVYTTINSYRKQGRLEDANQLQEENRGELSQRSALTATQKQVRGLNQAIEMVLRDKILTSDEKRDRIDKLMARRNAIVQQTVERVNPYFN
jgi:hypothetical protein